ncbi:MAG: type II toxin-antitoxin system PemK/MazF family toxin [Dissulfurispiraceae bacterium]
MRRGEIWIVNLDQTIGAEIQKCRPCLIVNDDAVGVLPLKIIASISDYKDKFKDVPWMATLMPGHENGLGKKSVIDLFQVRSVDEKSLVEHKGMIGADQLLSVKTALKVVFGCKRSELSRFAMIFIFCLALKFKVQGVVYGKVHSDNRRRYTSEDSCITQGHKLLYLYAKGNICLC